MKAQFASAYCPYEPGDTLILKSGRKLIIHDIIFLQRISPKTAEFFLDLLKENGKIQKNVPLIPFIKKVKEIIPPEK